MFPEVERCLNVDEYRAGRAGRAGRAQFAAHRDFVTDSTHVLEEVVQVGPMRFAEGMTSFRPRFFPEPVAEPEANKRRS